MNLYINKIKNEWKLAFEPILDIMATIVYSINKEEYVRR